MLYEELLLEGDAFGLTIREKDLQFNDGRQKGSRIAIRRDLRNDEKACVLAEELGHYHTSVGNILDQSIPSNRKQELHARIWAYNKLIGLSGILKCYRDGCRNIHEMAEYLSVTESFLNEALEVYRHKYGKYARLDNCVIYFEPYLSILEIG